MSMSMSWQDLLCAMERWVAPPKIEEIKKLHEMLDEAGIFHEFHERFGSESCVGECGGYQIIVFYKDGERMISAVEGMGTYGAEDDLIEIMGLLTPEEEEYDSVCGYLTAQNVFDRIVAHKDEILNIYE